MQLRHLLLRHFPDLDPARLPGGFDRVGDIAVVSLTPELTPHQQAIGALLLAAHPQLRVVARRAGEHDGAFRVRPLAVIGGEHRLTTVHRENGVSLHLDLGQVYFSVRMAHERARIAALVRPEERVAVLCSGAGPFPLIIARHSRPQLVVGIELNPMAHRLALTSLRANRPWRRRDSGEFSTGCWWCCPAPARPSCPRPWTRSSRAAPSTSTPCGIGGRRTRPWPRLNGPARCAAGGRAR
jgi:tRNA (guanine37-N1)-methyltransferase